MLYHQNYTIMMADDGCLADMGLITVGFLGGSVPQVDLYWLTKIHRNIFGLPYALN